MVLPQASLVFPFSRREARGASVSDTLSRLPDINPSYPDDDRQCIKPVMESRSTGETKVHRPVRSTDILKKISRYKTITTERIIFEYNMGRYSAIFILPLYHVVLQLSNELLLSLPSPAAPFNSIYQLNQSPVLLLFSAS